jgi:hypothetical protein
MKEHLRTLLGIHFLKLTKSFKLQVVDDWLQMGKASNLRVISAT